MSPRTLQTALVHIHAEQNDAVQGRKTVEQWQSNSTVTARTGGHVFCNNGLWFRMSSISVSGTTDELEFMKLHPIWIPVMERSGARMTSGPIENILFWWDQ
jgi:hypothetical protein